MKRIFMSITILMCFATLINASEVPLEADDAHREGEPTTFALSQKPYIDLTNNVLTLYDCEGYTLLLYNQESEERYSFTIANRIYTIDITSYNKGMYLLQLISKDNSYRGEFVKKN